MVWCGVYQKGDKVRGKEKSSKAIKEWRQIRAGFQQKIKSKDVKDVIGKKKLQQMK